MSPGAKTTIADVARSAQVSTGTVSHVLSGARNVRPETRARVERAIDELGFRPSTIARALAAARGRAPGARRAELDRRPRIRSFKQELVGLFGQPVSENPTQVMVESAFRDLGLDWRYLTLEVAPAALGDAVRGARAFGFRGFHCTIPHKVAVIEHLDRIGESATAIGAVNCVVRRDDELVGENTDGKGFLRALKQRFDPPGASVVLLGAGGAARAIAVELMIAGAGRIHVVNRTATRGEELVEHLRALPFPTEVALDAWRGDYAVPSGADVLVNATSIGLFPEVDERVPVDLATLSGSTIAADVVPNPPRTRFLQEAEAAGCRTVDGFEMLVEQGALSVTYWTGREPDTAVMQAALTDAL